MFVRHLLIYEAFLSYLSAIVSITSIEEHITAIASQAFMQ